MRGFAFVFVLLLAGCATQPQVIGRYAAQVSAVNVQQIRDVTRSELEIREPIHILDAITPNRVRVQTRSYSSQGARYNQFTVIRRDGRWSVDHRAGGAVG